MTVADLVAQRKTMAGRTLNDDVDDIHLRLWEDPNYRRYFDALWASDTIEGSFIADDIGAAVMIREYAKNNQFPFAARAKLHSIVRSLHVVCRRYAMSRRDRQRQVHGEAVNGAEAAMDDAA
jgi:hypothetical protein